jgi:(p)ppGpp synthase/HD superfamily hydrolase
MTDLSKALMVATQAHDGQVDKQGVPYILHPIRVMLNCQTEKEKVVAICHDLLEDCNITVEDLKQMGFSQEIINAIISVSRLNPKEEKYIDFIYRAKNNSIGRMVKICDIRDNLRDVPDESKIRKEKRLAKYKEALAILLEI